MEPIAALEGTEAANVQAKNLGWTPALKDYTGDGEVFAGEPVYPAADGDRGLTDRELLYSTLDSASVNPEGSWSATAGLTLKTPATVKPGRYSAKITLSLIE